jgi:acyl-CoA synthetase (AMP-forming)/AMP-acid ligase II
MEEFHDKDIYTQIPKGILVVGNTGQLNSKPKRDSFQVYRRNLINPEVITYDELYERAKAIVQYIERR